MYTIWCDGSTRINNTKGADNIGGFGFVVYNELGDIIDMYSEQVNNTTNNRMELSAIIKVIEKYGTQDPWEQPDVYTDSQYALMALTVWAQSWERNGWQRPGGKEVENLDLIQYGYKLLNDGNHYINLIKCSGHIGIEGNEIADKLATGILTPTIQN